MQEMLDMEHFTPLFFSYNPSDQFFSYGGKTNYISTISDAGDFHEIDWTSTNKSFGFIQPVTTNNECLSFEQKDFKIESEIGVKLEAILDDIEPGALLYQMMDLEVPRPV